MDNFFRALLLVVHFSLCASYREEGVILENQKAGVALSGTLTLPLSEGPFPAVVLIAGAGPMDRDETITDRNKPFLLLAEHLTEKGFAVFRADKRGVGKSTGTLEETTIVELASDVQISLDYLKERGDISSIGLIGHSQGGMVASIVAASSDDVAFLVMMAAPGVCVEDLIYEQTKLILLAEGGDEEQLAMANALLKRTFQLLKQESDKEKVKKLIPEIVETMVNCSWFRHLLTYNPASVLQDVKVPVLILSGDLDLQVPPTQNVPPMLDALDSNDDVTVVEFSHLNHLFQNCNTGSPSEYQELDETIAPAVLETISEWTIRRSHFVERMDISSLQGKKIGYYVGSFDPIHLGHEEIVKEALRQGIVDYVLVYPVPGCELRKGLVHTVFATNPRVLLTHLSPKALQNHLSPLFAQSEFIGMIGSDIVPDFTHDPKKNSIFMRGLPIPDKNANTTIGAIMAVPATSFSVFLRNDDLPATLGNVFANRSIDTFISLKSPYAQLSSTKIREACQAKLPITGMVHPKIESKITKEWGPS